MTRPHLPHLSADDRGFWLWWLFTVAVVVGIAGLIVYLSNVAEWGVL
ncbi:hypothetical protein GV794_02160 [Nocardia cyriacigeorgica]|uniref:Uncharacterized protein n=1 Tax=Nocardia cyriacigeorgica TaxID=135487 RepID=A0ABX0CJF9_9NOCA|nr:hypothetical protein [Nocardia cyriacigeorgica]NEW42765.1 hypothetical protein [Nocardia cyriacigeorgica]NEW53940.1 hypothetical protein [Nocardia cyriacigeorgica]NEW54471.1 hypothetical protein [Nocardia cyriacigeorgica]